MVLFCIAIGSALVVGGAYVTRQLASASALSHRGARVEPLAERALVGVLVAWDSATWASHPVGATYQLPSVREGVAEASLWLTRLSERSYWLVAEARGAGKPLLQRRLAMLVHLEAGRPVPAPDVALIELP